MAFQISYKITPVLAQEDKDALEVKKVVETFLRNFSYQDIDSAMQYVSVNYSVIEENGSWKITQWGQLKQSEQ